MLKDGLVYSESRMGYEQEFMEDLAAFELNPAVVPFREVPFCSERMISAIPITVTAMI